MSNITSKEYLKNLIVRGIKGEKIDQTENEALEKEVANFTVADWRNFKRVGKEALKEEVDKLIEGSDKVPTNWKSEIKNLTHALFNFSTALFSEEIIMESMRLEREKAPVEQRIKVLAPLLTHSLEKVASRKKEKNYSNYHKGEVTFSKRYKQIKAMISLASLKGGDQAQNPAQVKNFIGQFLKIFKNLRPEEVKVFKQKGKEWIEDSLPPQIKSQPESESLIKAFINFCDAVLDEELLAESNNLLVEVFEIALKEINFEELVKIKNPIEGAKYGASFGPKIDQIIASRGDLKNRGRALLVKLTNHLNHLAGGEDNQSQISPTEEAEINQRLAAARELSDKTNNSSNKSGSGLSSLSPVSLLDEGGLGSLKPQYFDFEKLDKKLSQVETREKWYKNPLVIVPSLIGAVALGSLITWLFLRKKASESEYKEY